MQDIGIVPEDPDFCYPADIYKWFIVWGVELLRKHTAQIPVLYYWVVSNKLGVIKGDEIIESNRAHRDCSYGDE